MAEKRPDQRTPQQLNVLVVEDYPNTADLMVRVLSREGFHVTLASDVESAMRVAEKEHIDILVSDLCLPDGTGWELMEALRAHGPVHGIVVSALSAPENVRRSYNVGFEAHLVKPVDIDRLVETVHDVAESN